MLLWWSFTVIAFSVPYQPTHCLELCFMPITQYIHSFWAEYFWEAHEDELSENVILETQKHGIKCNKPKHIISIQRKVYIISLLISWLFGLNWSFSNFKVESIPRHFLPWVFPLGASYKNRFNTYFRVPSFQIWSGKEGKREASENSSLYPSLPTWPALFTTLTFEHPFFSGMIESEVEKQH